MPILRETSNGEKMNIDELHKACLDQIELCKQYDFAEPFIALTVPKGKTPKRFIRGELVLQNIVDGVIVNVYRYDARKIIAWMKKNDLVKGDENAG